jgi:hypothetical protein
MSIANPLWGAPRIHGELLKLGINVGQTTVAKYVATKYDGVGLRNQVTQPCFPILWAVHDSLRDNRRP